MDHSVKTLISDLEGENIKTWFDLGLFMDRLKDKESAAGFGGDYYSFKEKLVKGGIGFITFYYSVDGVTVEVTKYADVLRQLLPGVSIHLIAGGITPESAYILPPNCHRHVIPEIQSFDDWDLYQDFFKTKLQRGSKEYNALIINFWKEVILLTKKLAELIKKTDISVLFLLNVCSNPGNVSLALACILVSEYWGIPVINNNHDFYWEEGNKQVDIEIQKLHPGPRDFFFTNADVGEFFSTLEVAFPWESRSWMTVNINENQMRHVVVENGHNPANTVLLGTVVDISEFEPISKRESFNTLSQIGDMFNNQTYDIRNVLRKKADFMEKPFLCGDSTQTEFDFIDNNILMLQPTRVIRRKQIEINFKLIEKLLLHPDFMSTFKENRMLKISLIVSGPISTGQRDYFCQLLHNFSDFLKQLPQEFRGKIFLGFLFSAFDSREFQKKFKKPINIVNLYKSSSLILLPSESEGRGLPLIEAAAAGKPVFCRRYNPEKVYAEVIGEHLDEALRLKVLEFRNEIPDTLIQKTVERLFYPQDSIEDVVHNKNVIKVRYNLDTLRRNLKTIIYKLFLQLSSIADPNNKIGEYFIEYDRYINFTNDDLEAVINTKTREYLPGYGRLGFMILLKSLIDPSYFRVEEQYVRGEIHLYAQRIWAARTKNSEISLEKYHEFFNAVNDLFHYHQGKIAIRHDHSLAYRHRNKKLYPYRNYTIQELTGLVNMIFDDIVDPQKLEIQNIPTQFFFTDWNLALVQLTTSHNLGIDNRAKLFQKLKQKIPRAYFPGQYVRYEMEFFVLQPIRAILALKIEEELTELILNKNISELPKVYVIAPKSHLYNQVSESNIKHHLESTLDRELNLLYKSNVVEIVKTPQSCIGFHLRQMGPKALKILRHIKEQKGFIITNGQNAAMMTDILDIDRFHIGKVKRVLTAKIMGIPMNSGFIQFVPAGVRTTIAYPTPVQTSKDFEMALKSKTFKRLEETLGEERLYELMREDAQEKGTPIKTFMQNLGDSFVKENAHTDLDYRYVGGVYKDNMPWSGVLAEIEMNNNASQWKFTTHIASASPKPVTDLIQEYFRLSGKQARIAWNGGYILNPELVGKLGLPETYIGSPLGLLMVNKEVKCPPLFNKPAFLIYEDGKIDIQRVNSKNGLVVSLDGEIVEFQSRHYNTHSNTDPCYYDLSHGENEIEGYGNIIIRLAGNIVKEVIRTHKGETVQIIPVGITLSIPKNKFPEGLFKRDQAITIRSLSDEQPNWDKIGHAVEAGPLLIENGRIAIDMQKEGWKTDNSIKTQAARIDFTDMRGPKIAVGLTKENRLLVLAINGRIRESVGATHGDMVDILIRYGAEKAMGFDPGGSSTLVMDGKTLNISPYNKAYEKDVFSLPPEPRFISNAVLGWQE